MIPDAMPCPTCKAPACPWLASYHDQGFRNANPWCHAVPFTEQLYGYWCAACQAWVPLTENPSPKGTQEQPTSISGQPSLCAKCGNHSIVVRYEYSELLQEKMFAFWCTTCKRWDIQTRKYTGQPLIGIENFTIHMDTPVCPTCNTLTVSMLSQSGDIPQDGLDYLDHSAGWTSHGIPAWYCEFCKVYVPNVKDSPVTEQPTSISEPVDNQFDLKSNYEKKRYWEEEWHLKTWPPDCPVCGNRASEYQTLCSRIPQDSKNYYVFVGADTSRHPGCLPTMARVWYCVQCQTLVPTAPVVEIPCCPTCHVKGIVYPTELPIHSEKDYVIRREHFTTSVVNAWKCPECEQWIPPEQTQSSKPVTSHDVPPTCPDCHVKAEKVPGTWADVPQDGRTYRFWDTPAQLGMLYVWWCAACKKFIPCEPVARLGDTVTVSIGDDTYTDTITDNPETDTEPSPTTPPCPVCANPLVKPFDFPKGSGEWFCPICIDWFGPVTGEPHIKAPTPSPEHPEPAQEIGPTPQYPHTGSGKLYWEDTWQVVHVIDDMEHLLLRYMAGLSVDQKDVRRLLKQSTRLQRRAKKALDCGL